jgi:predicted enzyme related to lactoylglutathione lyase
MTTAATNPLAMLAKGLESEVSGTRAELTSFPSGGAMLDVYRGDGRMFVLSYAPDRGYGVDEVLAGDGFISSYRFSYPDLHPAAEKLRELVSDHSSNAITLPKVSLSLVVVRARDVEAAKHFYSRLGLVLRREQHGDGPQHYSAEVGSAVFEIYPCPRGEACGGVRIGFAVASVDEVVNAIRQSAKVVKEPTDSSWGRRAVVEDPDGNRVELTES